MINPAKLLKLKGTWDKFVKNHPKFPQFMNAVKNTGLEEGSVIAITVTTAEGKELSTNIKVTQSDKEMLSDLTELLKNG